MLHWWDSIFILRTYGNFPQVPMQHKNITPARTNRILLLTSQIKAGRQDRCCLVPKEDHRISIRIHSGFSFCLNFLKMWTHTLVIWCRQVTIDMASSHRESLTEKGGERVSGREREGERERETDRQTEREKTERENREREKRNFADDIFKLGKGYTNNSLRQSDHYMRQ